MMMQIFALLLFGLIGYFLGRIRRNPAPNRLNILLVVLLIVAANTRGLGFSGIGEFVMQHNDILQGLIAGILIGRLSFKPSLVR